MEAMAVQAEKGYGERRDQQRSADTVNDAERRKRRTAQVPKMCVVGLDYRSALIERRTL